jgi:hypothetical protein
MQQTAYQRAFTIIYTTCRNEAEQTGAVKPDFLNCCHLPSFHSSAVPANPRQANIVQN